MVNLKLTPGSYHSAMQSGHRKGRSAALRERARIWSALALASLLHLLFLLLPTGAGERAAPLQNDPVEIWLTDTAQPESEPAMASPDEDAGVARAVADPPRKARVADSVRREASTATPLAEPAPPAQHFERLTEAQKRRMASAIRSRYQFGEETVGEQIFGRRLDSGSAMARKDFQWPERSDLISMLDQPLPEVPFAYTPGLVRFAYDPGVRGDLQRFWDVITPEFGWRTDNGTEFKCVWVLVIAACGWK